MAHPKLDPTTKALYDAVENYVEKRGGRVLVAGGVTLQVWPQDNDGVFHLSVKCTGVKPKVDSEPRRVKIRF